MHRTVKCVMKTLTVKRDRVGHWFVTIICETPTDVMPSTSPTEDRTDLGIDIGLKSLVVTSSGHFVETPKFYRKAEKRLKKPQRELSRKQRAIAQRLGGNSRKRTERDETSTCDEASLIIEAGSSWIVRREVVTLWTLAS
jgi:putative transposase